jgi:hypothetical protein
MTPTIGPSYYGLPNVRSVYALSVFRDNYRPASGVWNAELPSETSAKLDGTFRIACELSTSFIFSHSSMFPKAHQHLQCSLYILQRGKRKAWQSNLNEPNLSR